MSVEELVKKQSEMRAIIERMEKDKDRLEAWVKVKENETNEFVNKTNKIKEELSAQYRNVDIQKKQFLETIATANHLKTENEKILKDIEDGKKVLELKGDVLSRKESSIADRVSALNEREESIAHREKKLKDEIEKLIENVERI